MGNTGVHLPEWLMGKLTFREMGQGKWTFLMGVRNDEVKLRGGKTAAARWQSTVIKMKMYVGEKSVGCSADFTWESRLPPTPHPRRPRHFQSALDGSLAFWEWKSVMKKTVHGKCLGMLCSDVWQNESARPWKWECHKHGRGVSSTRWWFIGWGAEVIFSGSLGMCCCQLNFSRLLIPERKWV